MGESDFHQFMRLKNQLAIATGNFGRLQILSPTLILALSKDMDEKLKLAHRVFEVLDRSNKICMTMLRYIVDKPKISHAAVRLFARYIEEVKFQKTVFVKQKLAEYIIILHVMNSVNDDGIANQSNCNVL